MSGKNAKRRQKQSAPKEAKVLFNATLAQYKMFDADDWVVMAKMTPGDKKPEVLYEGDSRAQAYEAVLADLGIEIHREDRDMPSGSYEPTAEDFKDKT